MKKLIFCLLTFVILISSPVARAANDYDDSMDDAELAYLCAWVSLASYDDRLGLVARDELSAAGYSLTPYREESAAAAPKYLMMRKFTNDGERILLAVTGTESKKDIENDLAFGKVPFAGKTPDEFAKEARRKEMTASEPLVHKGFNDYTQTAFFTRKSEGGETIGESLATKLKANPSARLCVTGHSLGGAAAILLAARLIDMGVPSDQIDVVTFGAPAVGNEAFAEAHKDMRLTRFVMSGDPVTSILQSVGADYTEFGEKIVYKQAKGLERFPHDMVLYVDTMLRDYYTDGISGTFIPTDVYYETKKKSSAVYLVTTIDFDEKIAGDAPYLTLAQTALMRRQLPPIVLGTMPSAGKNVDDVDADILSTICANARREGCDYAIIQYYEGRLMRDKKDTYKISLSELVMRSDGTPLTINLYTTSTEKMTPIIAALYDEVCARESRETAMRLK